jgi:Protein of unknown function (DUF1236)
MELQFDERHVKTFWERRIWNVNVAGELGSEYALCLYVCLLTFKRTGDRGKQEKRAMKTHATKLRLLVTAAAFVGCTAIAAAQTPQSPSGGGAAPAAGQSEQKGGAGGAMMRKPSGAQPGEKAPGATGAQSAQSPNQGMKPDQRTGQNAAPSEKNEKSSQRGTDMNTQQKGAQDERGMPQKGAQSESGKAGVKTQENAQGSAQGGGSSRAASVKLSTDQRTRIGSVIGKSSSARVGANVHIDVSVGARVPRDVHVAVLPADVIEIVPQYEGFDYVVVGEQILIIDPNTYEIVAVIEA